VETLVMTLKEELQGLQRCGGVGGGNPVVATAVQCVEDASLHQHAAERPGYINRARRHASHSHLTT
jgi:hypothetical protein